MTATGDFPAPGPQDRVPPRDESSVGPAPGGNPMQGPTLWPQTPMLTSHRPGIVPLRPLQIGDILDGAIKAVRFNPKSMVGLSAVVLGAFLLVSALLGAISLAASSPDSQSSGTGPFIGGAAAPLIQFLFTTLATGVLSGLLSQVVGQAVLGRRPSIGETWRATRGRVPSLLLLTFLTLVFGLVSAVLLIGPGVLLLVSHDTGVGLALLILGILCAIALTVFVSTKIALAGPAIVLEGHGMTAGLRRSLTLTRGAAFWRVLGITLLAQLIAGVVGWLLNLPFAFIGLIVGLAAGGGGLTGVAASSFVSHLSALLSGAITTPFVAAVAGLLYIDRRMRLEALDVTLVREAESNPAPRF
jgi:hypothetical protein